MWRHHQRRGRESRTVSQSFQCHIPTVHPLSRAESNSVSCEPWLSPHVRVGHSLFKLCMRGQCTAVFKMNARRTNMQFELRRRGKIAKFEESAGGLHKARILLLTCFTILLMSFRSHRLSKRSLEGREEKQVSMQTPTSPRSSTVACLSHPRPQLLFKFAQHTFTTYL